MNGPKITRPPWVLADKGERSLISSPKD